MKIYHYQSTSGKDFIDAYLTSLPLKEEIDGRKLLEYMENDEWDKIDYKHWEGKIYEVKFYKFNRIFYVVKKPDKVYLLHACKNKRTKQKRKMLI